MHRVKNGDLSDTDTLLAFEKLGKAATNAMAETTVTRAVNQDLVDATKKKEKRKQQNREDGADGSDARVMGREELLRRREFGKNKMFEAAWKEFSHAGFAVVFSCNITAKDKGKKPRSPTKPTGKPPAKGISNRSSKSLTKPQLPLPLFTDLIISSPSPTPNSGDHPVRKSPEKIVKKSVKIRALKVPPKAKSPTPKAPRKKANKAPEIEAQSEAPVITTRSGRTVKRTSRE